MSWRERLAKSSVVRAGGTLLMGTAAAAALNFVTFAVVARALGPDGYGNVVLVRGFVAVVVAFSNVQSSFAVIRFGAVALETGDRARFHRLLRAALALDSTAGVLGACIGAAVALLLGELIGVDGATRPWLVAYLISVPLSVHGVPSGVLRLLDRYSILAKIYVLTAALALVGALVATFTSPRPEVVLAVFFVADVLLGVLPLVVTAQALRTAGHGGWWRGSTSGALAENPGLLELLGVTNIQATVKKATNEVDVLVVGAFSGASGAALYKVAKQFGAISAKVLEPLYQVFYPEMAKLAGSGRWAELWRFAQRAGVFAGAIALAPLVVFCVAPDFIIDVTVGAAFAGASGAIGWYLGATVAAHGSFSMSRVLLVAETPRLWLLVTVPASAVYLAALVPCVERWGPSGAGAAYCAHSAAVALALFVAARYAVRSKMRVPLVGDALVHVD